MNFNDDFNFESGTDFSGFDEGTTNKKEKAADTTKENEKELRVEIADLKNEIKNKEAGLKDIKEKIKEQFAKLKDVNSDDKESLGSFKENVKEEINKLKREEEEENLCIVKLKIKYEELIKKLKQIKYIEEQNRQNKKINTLKKRLENMEYKILKRKIKDSGKDISDVINEI